ncbi:hypothetical protein [Frigoriglobus tundricola]|uniref:hypothetical protein n=1 Tax=Frigoriglobus tundricola TaxID=2774151 RepID=UPI00148E977A|nr:hypothetical protein [Frigoriglobus tundricola]
MGSALGQYLDPQWAAVYFVGALFLACVALRVIIVFRPGVAVWLGEKTFGAAAASLSSDLPGRLQIGPIGAARFHRPAVAEQAVTDLTARGFVEVGRYLTNLIPSVPVVLLVNPEHALRALLFEAENSRLVVELATEYPDGRYVFFSNCVEYGFDKRPGTASFRDFRATPLQVLDRCLAERPRDGIVPVGPEAAVAAFERESTLSLAWRKARGLTPREVGAVCARFISRALSTLIVGSAGLFVVAALVSAVCARVGDVLPLAAVVPLIVVAMTLPFLALVPLLRGSGLLPRARSCSACPVESRGPERTGAPVPVSEVAPPPAARPEATGQSKWQIILGLWPFLVLPGLALGYFQDQGYAAGTVFESEWIGRVFWGAVVIALVIVPWLRNQYEMARIAAQERGSRRGADTHSVAQK